MKVNFQKLPKNETTTNKRTQSHKRNPNNSKVTKEEIKIKINCNLSKLDFVNTSREDRGSIVFEAGDDRNY